MENLTVETFKEKVFDYTNGGEWSFKGSKPAIIDFYADWCGPCKMVGPILEELSTEYPGIDFYKIDTEVENELAAVFQIRSIPSILFIPTTGHPQMALGAHPKEKFKEIFKDIFGL
jgi:thioredoxin 1